VVSLEACTIHAFNPLPAKGENLVSS